MLPIPVLYFAGLESCVIYVDHCIIWNGFIKVVLEAATCVVVVATHFYCTLTRFWLVELSVGGEGRLIAVAAPAKACLLSSGYHL